MSFPNGFAAGDHSIYVSNWSVSPAVVHGETLQPGEVVRVKIHEHEQEHHDEHND